MDSHLEGKDIFVTLEMMNIQSFPWFCLVKKITSQIFCKGFKEVMKRELNVFINIIC